MAADYGVTTGHELYSTHRFRDDTKHMIIFDTIDDDICVERSKSISLPSPQNGTSPAGTMLATGM